MYHQHHLDLSGKPELLIVVDCHVNGIKIYVAQKYIVELFDRMISLVCCLLLFQKEEDLAKAKSLGASLVGGLDLVKQVMQL